MLRALLLDLDGTLVDTPQAIVEVAQRTLAALGLPAADPRAVKDTIGLPLPVALAQLLGTGPAGASLHSPGPEPGLCRGQLAAPRP